MNLLEKINFINQYQFTKNTIGVLNRTEAKNWSKHKLNATQKALKQYFIAHLFNNNNLSMPSICTDELWHAFILDGFEYRDFCMHLYNNIIWHTPDIIAKPCTIYNCSNLNSGVKNLANNLTILANKYPDYISFLDSYPIIFTIDRIFESPNGWIYTNNALDELFV